MSNFAMHRNGMFIRAGRQSFSDCFILHEVIKGDSYRIHQFREPKTILDIGAHIGSFAWMCHQKWPDTKITCVEPSDDHLPCLRANVEDFATVIRGAVSTTEGRFYNNDGASYASYYGQKQAEGCREQEGDLETYSISSLVGDSIDMLKLDCEGCEHILKQEPGVLDKIKMLAFEWHGSSIKDFLLSNHDWRWNIRRDDGELGVLTGVRNDC